MGEHRLTWAELKDDGALAATELARLRARVAELEPIERRAREVRWRRAVRVRFHGENPIQDAAAYILGANEEGGRE